MLSIPTAQISVMLLREAPANDRLLSAGLQSLPRAEERIFPSPEKPVKVRPDQGADTSRTRSPIIRCSRLSTISTPPSTTISRDWRGGGNSRCAASKPPRKILEVADIPQRGRK